MDRDHHIGQCSSKFLLLYFLFFIKKYFLFYYAHLLGENFNARSSTHGCFCKLYTYAMVLIYFKKYLGDRNFEDEIAFKNNILP